MIYSDTALTSHAYAGMVEPFNRNHVGPCSIDLTIGDHILVESLDDNGNGWVEMDITDGLNIIPKQFLLTTTAETIHIPDHMCGQIILRSSAARAGWNHALAGFIDAGWHGKITLELTNQLQLNQLRITKGDRLIQLVLHSLDESPQKPYGLVGNYQFQERTTPSNLNLSSIK